MKSGASNVSATGRSDSGKTLEGADTASSIPESVSGAHAAARVATTSARHGQLRVGYGLVIEGQAGKHPVHVFSYLGEPFKQVSTRAWYLALKRAGLKDFRFHDLRHTWASWHIQSGTPLFALQELGGWETERIVRRCAHLAADHLAAYVGNAQIRGTFLAHQAMLPKSLDKKY